MIYSFLIKTTWQMIAKKREKEAEKGEETSRFLGLDSNGFVT